MAHPSSPTIILVPHENGRWCQGRLLDRPAAR
jgi:hypothetical protein